MSVQPDESKKLINNILKIEGVLALLAGIFFMSKQYYSSFEFLGADGDMFLGFGLFVVGISNFIIADKFFPYKIKTMN